VAILKLAPIADRVIRNATQRECRAMGATLENGQVCSIDCDRIGRGIDISGQRFGELTALWVTSRDEKGHVVWLMQCDCGRYAERTAASVRLSARNGHHPRCSECLAEVNGGRLAAREVTNRQRYIDRFRQSGTLYSDFDDDLLCEEISHELSNASGFSIETDPPPESMACYSIGDAIDLVEVRKSQCGAEKLTDALKQLMERKRF
jgi:hypothetical protein